VDPGKVSDVDILGLRLERASTAMKEFVWFQDSQNTRRAYLAETAELAYLGRVGESEASASQTTPRISWWMLWIII
jgi:hypothetical protein